MAVGLRIISTPQDTVSLGSPYYYHVIGDPAKETLIIKYSALNLPYWLTFIDNGNNTGTLKGIPSNNDVGFYQITLKGEAGLQSSTRLFYRSKKEFIT